MISGRYHAGTPGNFNGSSIHSFKQNRYLAVQTPLYAPNSQGYVLGDRLKNHGVIASASFTKRPADIIPAVEQANACERNPPQSVTCLPSGRVTFGACSQRQLGTGFCSPAQPTRSISSPKKTRGNSHS